MCGGKGTSEECKATRPKRKKKKGSTIIKKDHTQDDANKAARIKKLVAMR